MNDLTPNPKSAFYTRTSTEEQKKNQTINSQREPLQAEIQKNKEELVAKYEDSGFSGALLDRPALDQLRADAKQKRFTKLYILSPDRLARELMLQLLVVKELKSQGIEVVFLSQKFGDTPGDNLLFQMLGAIAEFEKAQILERSRRGKLFKARAGILIASIPKFGYHYIRKTDTTLGRYEINDEETKTVRLIFRLLTSSHILGIRTLSKELHRLGIKNRSGNTKWAKSTLSRIVKDSTYMGVTYYNKYMACEPLKDDGKKHYKKNRSRRLRPKEEWIPIKVPAIITPEEYSDAQQKLARNTELSDRNAKYHYLIKGITFCTCGKKMYGYPCHGKPRYKCSDKYSRYPLPKICSSGTVDTKTLDDTVWRAFMNVLERPEVVADKINKMHTGKKRAQDDLAEKTKIIDRELTAIKEQDKRLLKAYTAKVIDLPQLKSEMNTLAAKRATLLQEKQHIEAEGAECKPELTPNEVKGYFYAIKEKARNADFDLKQQIIRLFANQVIVNGRNAMIKAYLPSPVSTASITSLCNGPNGDNVSTPTTTSLCHERNRPFPFEIEVNLERPERILVNGHMLSEENKSHKRIPLTLFL